MGKGDCKFVPLDDNTSIFLNIVRFFAIEAVVFGHSLNWFGCYPLKERIPYIQSMAVQIFFLLSGFLTMYSYQCHRSKNPQYSLGQFFCGRFSRIYITYVASLMFIFLIDSLSIFLMPDRYIYTDRFNWQTLMANFFMLQDFPSKYAVFPFLRFGKFGSAGQLWTLPIEWWNYVIFGLLVIGFKRYSKYIFYWFVILLCGIYPFHNLVAGYGNGLTFSWWLGVLTYFIYNRLKMLNVGKDIDKYLFLIGGGGGVLLAFLRARWVRIQFKIDHDPLYSVYLVIAFLFLVVACFQGKINLNRYRKLMAYFSSFSYSLYLTHYSIVFLSNRLFYTKVNSYLMVVLTAVFCNIIAWIFSLFFEGKTAKQFEKFASRILKIK